MVTTIKAFNITKTSRVTLCVCVCACVRVCVSGENVSGLLSRQASSVEYSTAQPCTAFRQGSVPRNASLGKFTCRRRGVH